VRIVHLTDRLTDRGGAPRHLLSLVRAQAERGHDVHVVAGREGPLSEDVSAVRHRLPGLDARTARRVGLDALLLGLEPDVVHVHTVMNPIALDAAAAWGAVFTVQDHRPFCPARGKWTAGGAVCRRPFSPEVCAECFDDPAYEAEMLGLTRARRTALAGATVVVLSDYMRGELVAAGLRPDLVHVVPPFADFPEDRPPAPEAAGPPCVLFAGRLVAAKGPLDAVDAWRRSGVGLPLVVAGTGPLRDSVEAAGAEVLGWTAHRDLPALFRRSRALLMTSRWQEPFGIVGLEAASFGVPVAAWDSGGIREWHRGPLAAWGDLDGLAQGLRDAVGSRASAPEGFERDVLMDRLERIYGLSECRMSHR
jgi:glycosyltransferase involved in cell wall biosynthesis